MDPIQSLLLQLKQGYIDQLADRLDGLEDLALGIEKYGFYQERYNELYREVHSLKGSGGTHNLHIITNICHPLEDYLSAINDPAVLDLSRFADIVLGYIDVLRDVTVRLKAGSESFSDIDTRLASLRAKAFLPQRSCLVVENSAVLIKILSQALQSMHFRVITVDDGYVALGRALAEPFDLLISGNEIKHLNGPAMFAAIRLSSGINAATKSVLLSTNRNLAPEQWHPDYLLIKDDQLSVNLTTLVRSAFGDSE